MLFFNMRYNIQGGIQYGGGLCPPYKIHGGDFVHLCKFWQGGLCPGDFVLHSKLWRNNLYQLVQYCLKMPIMTISGNKLHAMSAKLVWSYILLWRNHLKDQPPRSVVIGAKTEKHRFDLKESERLRKTDSYFIKKP